MERVREHRVREAKMLMEHPQFRGAIEAIRDRLKVRPEKLRNKVRVSISLDGTPAYYLLEKHLRQMNLDIAPRGFRAEIRDLLGEFSLRSWWWEEWLVRHVLFDEFDEERIPDKGYKLGVWAGPIGQDEFYIRIDLSIPTVDQALGELSRLIKTYRRLVTGPNTRRLRSMPNFERDLDWWRRVRIFGQSPEEIIAEYEERNEEEWDREMRILKDRGMKEVDAHGHLQAQWKEMGRPLEPPDPDVIRLAVQRLDERYRQLFGIDPANLGQSISDA